MTKYIFFINHSIAPVHLLCSQPFPSPPIPDNLFSFPIVLPFLVCHKECSNTVCSHLDLARAIDCVLNYISVGF